MQSNDGMSFAEFTYPLLQAWDWWHMYQSPNTIQIQVGGADQYGNILTGIETISWLRKNYYDAGVRIGLEKRDRTEFLGRPMGFTVPLLTTASGQKYGKSEGNAVWLDDKMTSPFVLYGVRTRQYTHRYYIANATQVLSEDGRRRRSSLPQAVHVRTARST